MRHFIDRLQIWLYLAGYPRLAAFVGQFGTPPLLQAGSEDDRITLPEITVVYEDPSRQGANWCLDELPDTGPLKIIDFDPTFNDNKDIDVGREVAFPTTPLDVN